MRRVSSQWQVEHRSFIISSIGMILFAAVGIAAALWTGSQSVLIDALSTLVGVPVAFASIAIVRAADAEPTNDFPVGLIQARPLLALFRALFMTGAMILAIFEGIQTISGGGRALPQAEIVAYSVLASLGAWSLAAVLATVTRNSRSSLARLEFHRWLKEGAFSFAIGVVFAVGNWIAHPIVQRWVPYFDSLLVIVIGMVFLPSLLKKLIKNGKELLLGAPNAKTQRRLRKLIATPVEAQGAHIGEFAVIASGGSLFVLAEVQVSNTVVDIHWMTQLRSDAAGAVQKRYPDTLCWLTFSEA